jgi:hypothetical protein
MAKKPWNKNEFKKNTTGERGDPSAWKQNMVDRTGRVEHGDLLAILGITSMPKTFAELKKCWRSKMREVHPDLKGGNHSAAIKVNDAYYRLFKIMQNKQEDKPNG